MSANEAVRKTMQKENGVYAQVQRAKQDKNIGKKNNTVGSVASVGVMTTAV